MVDGDYSEEGNTATVLTAGAIFGILWPGTIPLTATYYITTTLAKWLYNLSNKEG